MPPLRKLREAGKPTAAQISEPLAENIAGLDHQPARAVGATELSPALHCWENVFMPPSPVRGRHMLTKTYRSS